MKKYLILLLASLGVLVLVGGGCIEKADETDVDDNGAMMEVEDDDHGDDDAMEDESAVEVDVEAMTETKDMTYGYTGELEAITTDAATGTESGTASATFADDMYSLLATFEGLPELDADEFFYEGWVVRKGANMSVISSGALEQDADGNWMNVYQSETDLTDHDFYVLTLEPNDDDPAPADHVLEGTMTLQ